MKYVIINNFEQNVKIISYEKLDESIQYMNSILNEHFGEFVTFEKEVKIKSLEVNEKFEIKVHLSGKSIFVEEVLFSIKRLI